MGLRLLISSRWALAVCLLAFGLALADCTAQFISNYDEIFDKAVSETQKKTDAFLFELQDTRSPVRRYDRAQPRYADILNDIHSLKLRAQANNAQGLNKRTLEQIGLLEDNLRKLQAQHEKSPRGPNVAFVRSAQDLIDVQFESILKLEIAKKHVTP